MADIGQDLQRAAAALNKGGLVAIPTETVYGLAAKATDALAVQRIFEAKKRPAFDPLIIHLPEREALHKYVHSIPQKAVLLAEVFWPGPLTLVLPKKDIIPDIATSGLDTVGVRIPDHPLTKKLLAILDFPLAAPSANLFGYVSPVTPAHVDTQLGNEVDYILDGGRCRVGLESTIIGFQDDTPIVYRKGGISLEEIEKVIGTVEVLDHSTSNPRAPGMLKSHYAPSKKLVNIAFAEAVNTYSDKKIGFLGFNTFEPACKPEWQLLLSPKGDLHEAAFNLFDYLRKLEGMEPEIFVVAKVPDQGLGRAINDRLKRAASEE